MGWLEYFRPAFCFLILEEGGKGRVGSGEKVGETTLVLYGFID
jgi:hypothetical protein